MYARDNVADARAVQKQSVSDSVIEAATLALGLLADATRLRLMAQLLHGEQDVTALTAAVRAARPAVSQHLGKLRLAGLVAMRRDGRRSVYAITDPHLRRLVTETLYAAEHRVSERPEHHRPAGAGAVPSPR